jgi:hypothetical protein
MWNCAKPCEFRIIEGVVLPPAAQAVAVLGAVLRRRECSESLDDEIVHSLAKTGSGLGEVAQTAAEGDTGHALNPEDDIVPIAQYY